jgi:carbohydrate-selective porin OprB
MNQAVPCLVIAALLIGTAREAANASPPLPSQLGVSLTLEGRSVLSGGAKGEDVSTGVVDFSVHGSGGEWTWFANMVSPFGSSLTAGPLEDFGVVSNIDADARARFQEAWIETTTSAGELRVGMLAADAEFWVSDQASIFHNSAFGAPTFVSASIPNLGVYPSAAFGVRIRKPFASGRVLSIAVLDGDPGDVELENPRGLKIHGGNGLLLLTEFAAHVTDASGFGTGWKIGAFLHSGGFTPAENLSEREGNAGVFALMEHPFAENVHGFVRAGAAMTSRSASPQSAEAGILIDRPMGLSGVGGLGFSRITINPFGDPEVPRSERIIEATYRHPITDGMTVQADVQRIQPSDGHSGTRSSVVAGLRLYIDL